MNTPIQDILLKAGAFIHAQLDKDGMTGEGLGPYMLQYHDRTAPCFIRLITWEKANELWAELEPEDLPKWLAMYPDIPTFERESSCLEDIISWAALLYMEHHA